MISPSTEPVQLSVDERIATLSLNRPEALNALDLPLARELHRVADLLDARDDVRVIVVRGNGSSFCAGADVRMFRRGGDLAALVREILSELHAFIGCVRRMRQVVITSVHGSVAGGGMSLASHGDLCIAAESTRFIPAYHRLALSPDMGATFAIARKMGAQRALQLFACEDRISARQALDWGLVNWVVPDDRLEEETTRVAQRVAANAPTALAATKRLVHASGSAPLDAQLNEELEAVLSCIQERDFAAAVGKLGTTDGGPRGDADHSGGKGR